MTINYVRYIKIVTLVVFSRLYSNYIHNLCIMKSSITICLSLLTTFAFAQYNYTSSNTYPFGKANPEAPEQIKDYASIIGASKCTSENRNPDGSWNAPVNMTWTWRYILNGMGVQDETLKADGKHSGSIRQFIADSTKWYVHYYSSGSPTTQLSTWEGVKTEENKIVLYKDQKAPNGTEGYSRLTFYDINESGYKWVGEWIDKTGKVLPTKKYDKVGKFFDSDLKRCAVYQDGKMGFVDELGNEVIPCQYTGSSYFSEGLVSVALASSVKSGSSLIFLSIETLRLNVSPISTSVLSTIAVNLATELLAKNIINIRNSITLPFNWINRTYL